MKKDKTPPRRGIGFLLTAAALAMAVPVAGQGQYIPLSAAMERSLKPKDSFKECAACPEMVTVPAGSFLMGSPPEEKGHLTDEGPQHKVTFTRPFAVGRYAVTFEEWDACAADGGCYRYRPDDSGFGRRRQPVINVNFGHAEAYTFWLSRKTGKPYRLLTESEREYVTRAGTTTPYWFGETISIEDANYDPQPRFWQGPPYEGRRLKPVPVDQFKPNPWGLYQVHGNIREWVEDCYSHLSYHRPDPDGSAFRGFPCGRVQRGGSWKDQPRRLRSAARGGSGGNDFTRSDDAGFRVARTLGDR